MSKILSKSSLNQSRPITSQVEEREKQEEDPAIIQEKRWNE